MKRFLTLRNALLALGALVVFVLVFRGCVGDGSDADAPPYEATAVRVGDLRSTVSATGTLDAVGTVTVGTQVSGEVERVFVDFNDRVEQGQILALVDPELLDAAVRDARAGVERAQAGVRQAESAVGQARAGLAQAEAQLAQSRAQRTEAAAALARSAPLAEQGYLSSREFVPIQTAVETAEAGVRASQGAVASAQAGVASAQAGVRQAQGSVVSSQEALRQALKNRRNAEIRAPIAGVVVQRSVEEGQTVAASFSTPELFVIAEDLGEMEILVQVDESDVGLVEAGQSVEFTVAAFPDETFRGVAEEVRLRPETVQNVVLYTVVVAADNVSGQLMPGMTATVEFVVGGVEDALLVPAAALRFEPPEAVRSAAREAQRDSTTATRDDAPAFSADLAEIWTPTGDPAGSLLRPLLVRVLATDGTTTAVAPTESSEDVLKRGLEVVTRMDVSDNPFD
ncbi:hypothetical protein B1759_16235 [Rubrivirga sp. SAORIC476]|uniref:efflux RND transporter periplasmic adaptor subunit n=1 Tax=Rubrivirga sp. SAORIC476 TaxID=1961794 RepID=UPI000BA9C527|nr:efflux RND transporter periplasmic adaptor subunit [Rubrivirga sp. SAORIC476]MAS55221.1 efflux transporter periplasmic adaptor subunit [Pimelobacter sp.]PAP78979.1 hypothetical protein B1759_16235 [Rubrivirga sp. SAORIC476]